MSWQELKEALTYAISKRCCSSKRLQCLHARTISSGLRHNLFISSLLITKYFSFGEPQNAQMVFDCLKGQRPTKALLWNALIRGYLKSGSPRLALNVYQEMVGLFSSGCEPDEQTFHLVITGCTHLSEFKLGWQVAGHIQRRGLESDLLTATALVSMCSKAGDLDNARRVFDRMPLRDAVSWNAMISGYSQAGLHHEAMALFRDMRVFDGVSPTEASLVSVISSCGNMGLLQDGEVIHGHAIKIGFIDDLFVSNSLMAMYIDCNRLGAAVELFHRMILKDAVTWSTMMGGYVEHKRPSDALNLFHCMVLNTGIFPTRPIVLNVLIACADLGDWQEGKWIEEKYFLNGSGELELDAHLITALVYMYAKCRRMDISLNHLEENVQVCGDVIAWNAMLKACAENSQVDWVLELTLKMQRRGINADSVTFLLLLSVICLTPLPMKGGETHAHIIKRGFESERTIANSLIEMYGKSGLVAESYKVFIGIQEKDVVSWSSIIKAHALNGRGKEALDLFQLMRRTKTIPNHYTFLALLSACNHAGLVEEGRELFKSMEEFGLEPYIEHFTCMVDIFCRAGLLKDAYHMLQNRTQKAYRNSVLWGALLSACRLHTDLVIGEAAASHLFFLEPRNAANYLMLANIYISAGRNEDANSVQRLMRANGLEMGPGCSWFEEG